MCENCSLHPLEAAAASLQETRLAAKILREFFLFGTVYDDVFALSDREDDNLMRMFDHVLRLRPWASTQAIATMAQASTDSGAVVKLFSFPTLDQGMLAILEEDGAEYILDFAFGAASATRPRMTEFEVHVRPFWSVAA